jgi:hypothetical protein
MSVFSKFQEAAKGMPLEEVANAYKQVSDKANQALDEKQAKEWEERFGDKKQGTK